MQLGDYLFIFCELSINYFFSFFLSLIIIRAHLHFPWIFPQKTMFYLNFHPFFLFFSNFPLQPKVFRSNSPSFLHFLHFQPVHLSHFFFRCSRTGSHCCSVYFILQTVISCPFFSFSSVFSCWILVEFLISRSFHSFAGLENSWEILGHQVFSAVFSIDSR